MTKSERRRKARQRSRERERAASPPDALERAVEAVAAAPADEPEAEAESEFITGPVAQAPRVAPPAAQRAPQTVRREAPRVAAQPVEEDDEDDEDEDDLIDGEEGDEDEDDTDGEEGDEDEDLDDQEEALFQVACSAVEQGEALGWEELVALLMTAEVLDPRLALVVALLTEGAGEGDGESKHVPLPITGARVLRILEELELGELVEEAREVASLAPEEDGDTDDERSLVRRSARELNQLSKKELEDGRKLVAKVAEKAQGRPLRASDVRARRTALSTGTVSGRRQG